MVRVRVRGRVRVSVRVRVRVRGTCASSFCAFFNFVCMAALAFTITLQVSERHKTKIKNKTLVN
jgi:hypothetical protein